MSTYETIRFEVIPMTARKSVKCSSCGKRVARQKTFTQTLNPWNKNTSGELKTRQEILAEHQAKAEAWKQQPETCGQCEGESA